MWSFIPKWKREIRRTDKAVQRIEKLNSLNPSHQKKIIKIAKNNKDAKVRNAAAEKIIDQQVLAEIAKNDEDGDVRMSAIKKLTDQNVLDTIAKNDVKIEVQIKASLRLTDLSLKTENLIRLINRDYHYKSEIVEQLKILYKENLLSERDKAKILQLNGKQIESHRDYTDGEWRCRLHADNDAVYFNL
jgi:hypothetical protein